MLPLISKIKILTVIGTRPEAIKLAPVINELATRSNIKPYVCITGQHSKMLYDTLRIFGIRADYDLKVMKKNQSLFSVTELILNKLNKLLTELKPDLIVVQGDTTTTLSASLAAFYHKIKVAYVEAGLRTNNKYSPFPEEINRRLVTSIADLNFAPTKEAADNLVRENINPEIIFITGNTGIDTLFLIKDKIINIDYAGCCKQFNIKTDKALTETLAKIINGKKIILITGHRRENFGTGFENICKAILCLSERDDVEIVYPVHLNPNVQEPVYSILGKKENIHLIEPLDYISFVYLMNLSYIILTDSGGIQEEAPSLGKPVLVMRDVTERPEAVKAGTVKLTGTNVAAIVSNVSRLIDDKAFYQSMSFAHNPYGDGQASQRIVKEILRSLK